MRSGTYQHRALFCDALTSTHREFRVEEIVWPALGDAALAFVRTSPFFARALATERRAAVMLAGFADTFDDPILRDAVRLAGVEEWRHGDVFASLINTYDLRFETSVLAPLPPTRESFRAFGYRKTLEAFLGWGVLAIVRQTEAFPTPFVRIFESVLNDETRHSIFFANWVAYNRARRGRVGPFDETREAVRGFSAAAREMLSEYGEGSARGAWFAEANVRRLIGEVPLATVLEKAIEENRRLSETFDTRLKRLRFVVLCAEVAAFVLRRIPKRKQPSSNPESARAADA
jgi:hypothetical protein